MDEQSRIADRLESAGVETANHIMNCSAMSHDKIEDVLDYWLWNRESQGWGHGLLVHVLKNGGADDHLTELFTLKDVAKPDAETSSAPEPEYRQRWRQAKEQPPKDRRLYDEFVAELERLGHPVTVPAEIAAKRAKEAS